MPEVSAKRQITLPVADCEELGIEPGDEVAIFRCGKQINIIKREPGSAAGLLKGTKARKSVSDTQSRKSRFD